MAATTFHPKKNGGKIRKLQHKCVNHESVRNFVTKDTAFKHSVNLKLKFGNKSKKIGRVLTPGTSAFRMYACYS